MSKSYKVAGSSVYELVDREWKLIKTYEGKDAEQRARRLFRKLTANANCGCH